MPEETSPTVFHPSDLPSVPLRRPPSAGASYHVGLDTMMGRRSRHRPEEVAIDGFLLLDTGEYELVTALIPLDVFWKMKALDILGQVRTANRARAARPSAYPDVGSVWLVDGDLELPTTGSAGNEVDTPARRADGEAELVPLADEVARARAGGDRIRHRRSRPASLPAAGSRGLFARSGGHRTEGSPIHRDLARARHASGVPDRLSLDEAQRKSPARRRASLVQSGSAQSVPAQSSTSRCASSLVLPYFF